MCLSASGRFLRPPSRVRLRRGLAKDAKRSEPVLATGWDWDSMWKVGRFAAGGSGVAEFRRGNDAQG